MAQNKPKSLFKPHPATDELLLHPIRGLHYESHTAEVKCSFSLQSNLLPYMDICIFNISQLKFMIQFKNQST